MRPSDYTAQMVRIFFTILLLVAGVFAPALADVGRVDACLCCDEAGDDDDCCDDGLCACCSALACVTPPLWVAVRERGAPVTQERPPGSLQSVTPRATSPPPLPPPIC